MPTQGEKDPDRNSLGPSAGTDKRKRKLRREKSAAMARGDSVTAQTIQREQPDRQPDKEATKA